MKMQWIPLLATLGAVPSCGDVPDEAEDAQYRMTLEVRLTDVDGQLSFVSPAGSVIERPAASVIGKPYYSATFEAGFSSGNDLPLFEEWGVVPEDLAIDIVSPAIYGDDDAYDTVFIIYAETSVNPGDAPPAAIAGDLATFTIDQSVVREGDPAIVPGVVRVVIEGDDAVKRVENRTPTDLDDSEDFTRAMTDTVMIVP